MILRETGLLSSGKACQTSDRASLYQFSNDLGNESSCQTTSKQKGFLYDRASTLPVFKSLLLASYLKVS
jgi:hypothetical protein